MPMNHTWPLNEAARVGLHGAVAALIDAGADVNGASEAGFTPLLNACADGFLDSARLLVEGGANVNVVSHNKRVSPLYAACGDGNAELVEYLVGVRCQRKWGNWLVGWLVFSLEVGDWLVFSLEGCMYGVLDVRVVAGSL